MTIRDQRSEVRGQGQAGRRAEGGGRNSFIPPPSAVILSANPQSLIPHPNPLPTNLRSVPGEGTVAARPTLHASRPTSHAPRLTPHASRLTPHAPRPTLHASRPTPHAPRSPRRGVVLLLVLALLTLFAMIGVAFLLLTAQARRSAAERRAERPGRRRPAAGRSREGPVAAGPHANRPRTDSQSIHGDNRLSDGCA